MEWEIRPLARKCAVTGKGFEPGETAVCLLYIDPETRELTRTDVLAAASEEYQPPALPIARWQREVRAAGNDREARQDALQSGEELFLALCEGTGNEAERHASLDPESARQSQALKHLLALLLERKRILRAVGKRCRSGTQRYLHIASRAEYEVPVIEIDLALLTQIQSRLDALIV